MYNDFYLISIIKSFRATLIIQAICNDEETSNAYETALIRCWFSFIAEHSSSFNTTSSERLLWVDAFNKTFDAYKATKMFSRST